MAAAGMDAADMDTMAAVGTMAAGLTPVAATVAAVEDTAEVAEDFTAVAVEGSTAAVVEDFTAAVVEDFTAAAVEDSTAAAVDMVADTDSPRII
jgi:hypothetical protein